jgi:3-oxoacyl-[acyl-carrier protein] reductase
MNQIDLVGRRAVVTGGAQGIGRAVAERFLASGASVALWDRDVTLAEATAGELGGRGRTLAVAVDVVNEEEVARATASTVERFGGIDILVANAGITGPNQKLWEYPASAWR